MPICEFCGQEYLTFRGLEELHSSDECLRNQLATANQRITNLQDELLKWSERTHKVWMDWRNTDDQLTAANQRLAESEGLLNKALSPIAVAIFNEATDWRPFFQEIEAFLTTAPPQATEPEYVKVRRDDLEFILNPPKDERPMTYLAVFNRLKAALDGDKP